MDHHLLDRFRFCPVCGNEAFETTSSRSKKCARCGYEHFVNASASTAAFILDAQQHLLVCRRAKEPVAGTLDLPGGFVDPDETLEEGLRRELMEETGCRVRSAQYLFSLPNRYEWQEMEVPTVDSFFRVELDTVDDLHPADDAAELFFVPLYEINPDDFGLKSIRNAVIRFLGDSGKAKETP